MKIAENEGFHSWISQKFSGGHPRAPVMGTPSGSTEPFGRPTASQRVTGLHWMGEITSTIFGKNTDAQKRNSAANSGLLHFCCFLVLRFLQKWVRVEEVATQAKAEPMPTTMTTAKVRTWRNNVSKFLRGKLSRFVQRVSHAEADPDGQWEFTKECCTYLYSCKTENHAIIFSFHSWKNTFMPTKFMR